ncbi:MAG: NTP transferase domain-containing protein [Bacteroidetes bacterium]|nr:NTP transferase domain-containing protein [Bacteroidota bacterium]
MKGIILHGGHGTRLRPLTHTGPKQLLPIANKPMSEYCIDSMKEAGVKDIAIIIGGIGSQKVKDYYGNGEKFGVNISYIPQDFPRGIAHAIGLCEDFINNEKFLVFLGDNIYQKGMPPKQSPERKEAERRLNEQINTIVNSNSNGIFIPGNHDWNNGDDDGWDRIKSVDKYIIDKKLNNVIMLPHNGCPGPEVIDLGDKIRLIIIDTDWWLNGDVQANKDNSKCNPGDEQSILDSLRSALKNKGKRFAIIAAHHPLESYGAHGGYFNWKQHIFPLRELNESLWIPLPVIGSLYPILRKSGISSQDLSSDEYGNMINKIEAVLSKYSDWIYAAGHEHSLQVLKGINNNLYLVSGFGTFEHDEYLTEGDKTIFAALEPGFMQLDFNNDGSIILSVISGKTGVAKEIFIMNVK